MSLVIFLRPNNKEKEARKENGIANEEIEG